MMQINYVKPDICHEDQKKSETLVKQMTELILALHKGAKYYTLTQADRNYLLLKYKVQKALVNNIVFLTERISNPKCSATPAKDLVMTGFTSNAFDPTLYASTAIKKALIESTYGRCAYCETLIQQTEYGEVDHFRPSAGYMDENSPTLYRPGYYALAYDPTNLVYTCQLCKDAFKEEKFPVLGEHYPLVPSKESPILINVYTENPRDFIRFNPLNGNAYPFDLVCQFYFQTGGLSTPEQVETVLWANPMQIPDQKDISGTPISTPQVNKDFKKWQSASTTSPTERGKKTIKILSLNRPQLVRARVSHLRQLRGLYWTETTGQDPDKASAEQLIKKLAKSGEPDNALYAPQYLSSTIDALNTWVAYQSDQTDWVGTYNKIIAQFVPERDLIEPEPYNDALMYLVLESQLDLMGQRRVVFLSGEDRYYGNAGGLKGLFFNINWKKDLKNSVLIKYGATTVATTTLGELVEGNPETLMLKFANYSVWAVGDYLPVQPNCRLTVQ